MAQSKKKPVVQKDKPRVKTVNAAWYKDTNQLFFILFVLVFTFICFYPALDDKKEFTNWDDPVYVTEQKIITDLNGKNIEKMFSVNNPVSLNYHPITVLSLAINYKYSKLEPFGYFFTNILFHLLNTLLVFLFVYRLTKKNFWVAALTSLFFGIHPMHVESVAWISERKDVLYCFFFLLSCITYLKFVETKRTLLLIFCFLFFLLSCLSKAMAVVLPAVLILIDYFSQRKMTWKSWLEKIPFFLLAFFIGIVAVRIQATGAIAKSDIVTYLQRFDFGLYGFMMYWVKLLFPIGLTAFYKYPNINQAGTIPLIYHLSPLIVLGSLGFLFYWFKKYKEKSLRTFIFGIGFFTITVAFVLQFIMVGSAIMADRYSYVPYIGSLFLVFSLLLPQGVKPERRKYVVGASLLVALVFGYFSFQRVKVWQNSEVLWTDVIKKSPYKFVQNGNVVRVEQTGVPTSYKNRGKYYRDIGQMDKAFADFDVLMKTNTADAGDCSNMGNLYALKAKDAMQKGDSSGARRHFDKAMEIYNKGLGMDPNSFEIYVDKGITYNIMGQHQETIDNFLIASRLKPEEDYLYTNIAFEYMQMGKFEESLKFCNNQLAKNPNDGVALFYRGTVYINQKNYVEAIADLTKSLSINPANGNAWFNLSIAQDKSGQTKEAIQSAGNARNYGYPVTESFIQELRSRQ